MTNLRLQIRRFFKPKSLRQQLLSRSLYIFLGLFLLVGLLQSMFLSRFLYRNLANELQTEIRSIPPPLLMSRQGLAGVDNRPNPLMPMFSMPVTVAVVDANNQMHTLWNDLRRRGSIIRLPKQDYWSVLNSDRSSSHVVTDAAGQREIVILKPLDTMSGPVAVIQVTTPTAQLDAIITQQVTIFMALGLFALVVGFFTFLPILDGTLKPLSDMVKTVRRINSGNLNERFTPQRAQAEIALLSNSFNEMLERIHDSFEAERESNEKMRQFVADASHELRTPLTSIHGFLEVLLRGAATNPNQLKRSLTSMYGESERMNNLVQDLILLARLDREPKLNLQEAALDGMIRDMEPQLRFLAGDRQVHFSIDSPIYTRFDSDRMKQVLLNLFQNAVQHTLASEGRIEVMLTRTPSDVRITVRDNGPGIPAQHVPHLFERFYRIDSSRSRKDGGVGLGLAITKSIVDSHGGTIACESTVGAGTSFQVSIPFPRTDGVTVD